MTNKEAIKDLKAMNCKPCKYHEPNPYYDRMVYCDDCKIKIAIEALEKLEEITKGIEDLKETLRDAYKSNDYVLDLTKIIFIYSLTIGR